MLTHNECKYEWLEVCQISLSAFRISPHRWYKPIETLCSMLNAFQCVAALMLAHQSYCTCKNTISGGNHKIDIYKQGISAVYTPRKKKKREILQNKEMAILPRWTRMAKLYSAEPRCSLHLLLWSCVAKHQAGIDCEKIIKLKQI